MRNLLAVTGLAAAIVATAGSGAAAAQDVPATPPCGTGDLSIALTPARGQVGMMHVGYTLSATNTSSRRCHIEGYPSVRLENARHRPVHTETHRGSTYFTQDPGAHRIVLAPGGRAVSDLEYSHIRQEGTEHARYARVMPPDATRHSTVRLTDPYVWQGRVRVTAFADHLPS